MSAATARAGRGRRGAVLLAVLVALAVLGIMAAALVVETRAAQTAARQAVGVHRAADAVEGALADALRGWAATDRLLLPPGASHVASRSAAPDLAVTTVTSRLAATLFAVTATAELRPAGSSRPVARRGARLLVSLEAGLPLPGAALTTGVDVVGGDAARLDGRDTLPDGWECPPADSATVPAVLHAPGATLALPPTALLGADPLVLPSAAAASPERYSAPPPPSPFAAAAARPIRLPATIAPLVAPALDGAGGCAVEAHEPHAWGDPRRPSPCARYLPAVLVAGDLVAPRGRGQGLLVVAGDLALEGGYEHWGVVVVGGRVTAHGAGNRVVGALLARGRTGAPHRLDALELRWSSCVAGAALRAAGVVRPVRERGRTEAW